MIKIPSIGMIIWFIFDLLVVIGICSFIWAHLFMVVEGRSPLIRGLAMALVVPVLLSVITAGFLTDRLLAGPPEEEVRQALLRPRRRRPLITHINRENRPSPGTRPKSAAT